jgi:valyl-tRNA synthetase
MIKEYGADAVRFTLAALTTEGQDIKLSPTRFEMGRNFINKLWNASRFVLMNLSEVDGGSQKITSDMLEFEDRWILSRMHTTIKTVDKHIKDFRYSDLAGTLREFAWHDVCDWYLEITKARFREGGQSAVVASRVLALVLDKMLRMLHPIVPFITEEIWSLLAKICPARGLSGNPENAPELIVRAPWPNPENAPYSEDIEKEMELTQEIIRAIRNVRSKFNIPPKTGVKAIASTADQATADMLNGQKALVMSLANAEELEVGVNMDKPSSAASEVMEMAQVFVPLSGLMDVDVERKRLEKELGKKQDFLRKSNNKLKNEAFLQKADPKVVQREKDLKEDLIVQIEKLETLLSSLDE